MIGKGLAFPFRIQPWPCLNELSNLQAAHQGRKDSHPEDLLVGSRKGLILGFGLLPTVDAAEELHALERQAVRLVRTQQEVYSDETVPVLMDVRDSGHFVDLIN